MRTSVDPLMRLSRLQRRASRKSRSAFQRAAKNVADERKLLQIADGETTDLKLAEVFPETEDFENIDPKSEVVSRAMDLIRPVTRPNYPEWRCRAELAFMMSGIRIQDMNNNLFPNMRQLKEQINEVAKAIKHTEHSIKTLPRLCRVSKWSVFSSEFCNLLDEVLKVAEEHRNHVVVEKGGRPFDSAKAEAATVALYMILVSTTDRPAKTVGGVFYELASILYEGGTGVQGADLQRYCRRVLDQPIDVIEAIFFDIAKRLAGFWKATDERP
jgi:hypothetical protein